MFNCTRLLLCASGEVTIRSGRLSRYVAQGRFGATLNNKAHIVVLWSSGGNHKVTAFRVRVRGRTVGSRHLSNTVVVRRVGYAKVSPHPPFPHAR